MRQLKALALHLIVWTATGTAGRAAFIVAWHNLLDNAGPASMIKAVAVGMRLDVAIGGYVTIPAAILLIAGIWARGKVMAAIWRMYEGLLAIAMSLAVVSNIGLYGYWGFPLDSTPLLYLRTSPADAMASLTFMQAAIALFAWIISAALMCTVAERTMKPWILFTGSGNPRHRAATAMALLLSAGMLILPIRGGVSTGTNHVGNVYFSTNMKLNHAAVNPVFSFMESVTHRKEIGTRYRFMDKNTADSILATMTHTAMRTDSATYLRPGAERPNLVVVILESFSKYIMEEGGHVHGVTPNLERLKGEGLYFGRFFANSVRTDKAIVSVLSGLPAQPTMSIMSMPNKSAKLPSIAGELARQGYLTAFYYGGDVGYSNMQSYIMGTGFRKIVCDKDFHRKQRTGKWGVPDGSLLGRVLEDISRAGNDGPFFHAILTGSSHEPFDVPYESGFEDKELNAFAYADKCLGDFVNGLKALPAWDKTLVAIVPDHLGAWPPSIDNYALWRYEIPFIITGGALDCPGTEINTIGCQTDIPATLLAMLGMEHEAFPFSKDIMDKDAPHFAFFTLNDGMGLVTDSCSLTYDNSVASTVVTDGKDCTAELGRAKAYLQKLYDYLEDL